MTDHETQAEMAKRMYNARAKVYDDSWHPAFAEYIVKYLNPKPGHHILDLACGTGLVTLPAAQIVGSTGSVTGVDITDGMLAGARQRFDGLKEKNKDIGAVDFYEHDIADLDSLEAIKGKQFDAITCTSALVLLDSPLETIRSWYKYLKPGGILVTDATHPRNLVPGIVLEKVAVRLGLRPASERLWSQTEKDISGIVEAVGFEVEDVHLQEQQGWGKHYHEVTDGEELWEKHSSMEYAKLLQQPGVVETAKAMFLEEWAKLADKYGAVEEVDGVFVIKCRKPDNEPPNEPVMQGSCACGQTTWKAWEPPAAMCHCSCIQCRKVAGSAFISMMEFPFWAVSFQPRLVHIKAVNLTPTARRAFCGNCGSTLTYRYFDKMENIEIAMGTLDEDEMPTYAMKEMLTEAEPSWCWLKEKVSWFNPPDDGLKKYMTFTSEDKEWTGP
jgi:ubiquinone/menaquinone biosynthesis C-methylase UbiE